ncbi:sialate O-acetylesterase [bacterium]|nr:sialate O-acetylesterase [bacterium]
MKKSVILCNLIFVCLIWYPLKAQGDVRLPAVFGENMVLQRDMELPMWGWADPGEKVTVSVDNREVTTEADGSGKWTVRLEPLKAGGPYALTIKGKNTIEFENILAGDVWLCSGQSNMEMRVRHVINSDREVANAQYPTIRLFQIVNDLSPEPRDDCKASWEVCRPSTIGDFTAAGYFFGREIMREVNVPIGLINASWGGTTIEAWMSPNAREACPEFRELLDYWAPVLSRKPPEVLRFYRGMAEWEEDVHYGEYVGNPLLKIYGTVPESPVKLAIVPQMPIWVYNAMIAPLVPYGIKGVLWYQGESNAGRAYQYRSLLPALITDWRALWKQGDFPFLYVQLCNYGAVGTKPSESQWAELREAQLITLTVPKTAMAVTIDIGEAANIHPRNKQEVGRRLALAALKTVYGREIVASGPMYESMTVRDGKVFVTFTNTGSGLVPAVGESLRGFTLAGKDKTFFRAHAMIMGDEVAVWSDDVPNPVALRYGWADNPGCNLFNREGLPASPFRTDDWPGITMGKK